MTYADTVGGRPLGSAPVSVPFGPSRAPAVVPAPLPATGAPALIGLLAVALIGAGVVVRRRLTSLTP